VFSRTVIANTGERFSDFAPYVASVNDEDTVAFQAALRGGATGVFTGDGGAIAEVAGPTLLAGVTSHPDLNNAGAMSFYGEEDGAQGVFLLRDGRLHAIASTSDGFTAIGPLGPTMNEAGTVAFRAEQTAGVSGVFAGNGAAVAGEDPRAPAAQRRLECHGVLVIHGGDVGREVAEPLPRGRDHRPGEPEIVSTHR
jgi:hypothetical protein